MKRVAESVVILVIAIIHADMDVVMYIIRVAYFITLCRVIPVLDTGTMHSTVAV